MHRIATSTKQNRELQLPHASRNTNPHVSKSTGETHPTSVSDRLKSSQVKIRIVQNIVKPRSSMFKRRLIAADQASVFMAMMSVHISSGLILHQMTSDHNRSELGIQDHSNEQSSSKELWRSSVATLTMEQYLALSRENQELGVVKPKIRGNVNFEIKSQFMRELRENALFGNKDEDAHDHIDPVLRIVGLFNILGVSKGTIHAQVGCQICKGPHLDKDCPLNEEVKQVEEVRYRGISENIHLVTRTNKGKFCVGTGYYTRLITIPHYEKKGKAGRKYLAMRARGNLHGRSSVNERVDLRRFKRKVLRLILGTKAPR
ncbi:hypothetical protein Tco_1106989 [Tanacetum coccineum]